MKLAKALLLALIFAASGAALAQDGSGQGPPHQPVHKGTASPGKTSPATAPAPKAPKPRAR